MNDLKPVGFFDENAAREELAFSFNRESGFEPVYAIPSTHRVVSVELLKRLLTEWQDTATYKEVRAIIDNKEQP